jgi:hypothetical protein
MSLAASSLNGMDVWIQFGAVVALGVAFAIAFSYVSRKRSLRLIQEWARSRQFTILTIRQPMIVPLWKTGRGWEFFRATLRDSAGVVRECWIRCPVLAFVCGGKPEDFVEVIDDKKQV